MKLAIGIDTVLIIKVASFAGAWIETSVHIYKENILQVASFAGAWIETFNS